MINVLYFLSDLNDEQREFQQLARKFAREEILPKAAYYDQNNEVSVLLVCENNLKPHVINL